MAAWPHDLSLLLTSGIPVVYPGMTQYFSFNVAAATDDSGHGNDGVATDVTLDAGISGNAGVFTASTSRIVL